MMNTRIVDFNELEDLSGTHPVSFTLFGVSHSASSWTGLYLDVCELLSKKNFLELHRLALEGPSPKGAQIALKKKVNLLRKPVIIPGTNIYVESNNNANRTVCNIAWLIKEFKFEISDIEIKYRGLEQVQEVQTVFFVDWKIHQNSSDLKDTRPCSCYLKNEQIHFNGEETEQCNWRDITEALFEHFINFPIIEQLKVHGFSTNHSPLLTPTPKYTESCRLLSNNYYLDVNYSRTKLAYICGQLCMNCGYKSDEVKISYVFVEGLSKKTSSSKPVVREKSKLLPPSQEGEQILSVIRQDYSSGFRFDDSVISLIESRIDVKFDPHTIKWLKSQMFERNGGLYFLKDSIIVAQDLRELRQQAKSWLEQYSCFDLQALYNRYSNSINDEYIRDLKDFGDWFKSVFEDGVKISSERLCRSSSFSREEEVLEKIARVISDELDKHYGTLDEECLNSLFDGFTIEFLKNVVNKYTDEIVITTINELVCFQKFEALGLPDEFSQDLLEAFEQIEHLELNPTFETLNVLLSLKYQFNFFQNFNLPNEKTAQRLVSSYYQGVPRREWHGKKFEEVKE